MTHHGQLIVIEGPDGVGKTTFAPIVRQLLEGRGRKAICMSFPGREPGTLGVTVYDIHHDPGKFGISSLDGISRQTLHIAAHVDAIKSRIKPALEAGLDVILDRYWWSTWVYGIADGLNEQILEDLIRVERLVWHPVNPAIILLMHRDTPISRDVEIDYWMGLVNSYKALASRESKSTRVESISNTDNIEATTQEIELVIENLFSAAITDGIQRRHRTDQLQLIFGDSHPKAVDRAPLTMLLTPAKPTAVLNTYWRFAAERQKIFFRRILNNPAPWTDDSILETFKFTNAYRASDRVSQYLIRNVIYRDDLPSTYPEVFFRIMLFKLFNKIETWELLEAELGAITYEGYSFERYDVVLENAIKSGKSIYSAAYIMPSAGSLGHQRKHRNHLALLEMMMADELPLKLTDATRMQQAFELVRSYPSIGDFLAYQYITDINYSHLTNFSEMEFVVPGPGARDGLKKCFTDPGGLSEPELIRMVADIQEKEFERLGFEFDSLWGRRLQLIDCQNLFCEVDKYSRVAHPEVQGISGRTKIKQRFRPQSKGFTPWYPPKWEINANIASWLASAGASEDE